MEYVLVDIKNFLRKLECGQLEIEAGQWELHKALSNMGKVVSDLKNLKEDVEDVRLNSMQQMGLIKELQLQLDKLNNIQDTEQPLTVSESSVEYERVYKRPTVVQATSKGFKKRKCRIRSEEIIEITSQVSNDKSQSGVEDSGARVEQCPGEAEDTEFTTGNDRASDEESCLNANACQTESYAVPKMNHTTCHMVSRAGNNDMLQRYLKDSIKYIERKTSDSTPTNRDSPESEVEKSHSTEYTPFWDEYSSRAPPECCENRNPQEKENAGAKENPGENILPKKFLRSNGPKKIMHNTNSFKHERKQKEPEPLYCNTCGKGFRSKERLKDHEAGHRASKSFKGFRCSYCGKTCSSPESLTAHLRNCRIIMKAHYKRSK